MENKLLLDMKSKSTDEKLDILEGIEEINCFNEADLELLECYSLDDDNEVRAKVAELLVSSNSLASEKILIKLVTDKTELVRVNACDSLSNSRSLEVVEILKNRVLKDRSSLVRGYAALSIGDIAVKANYDDTNELKDFFRKVLEKERVTWVKINIYRTLYVLGDKSYLIILMNELRNRYYRNRSLVVNILEELTTSDNLGVIEIALNERLKIEKTVAVRNKIEKFFNELRQ